MSLSSREKKYTETLQKRADFLENRIVESKDKDLSYDRAEKAALSWAIYTITTERKEFRTRIASNLLGQIILEYDSDDEAINTALEATDKLIKALRETRENNSKESSQDRTFCY